MAMELFQVNKNLITERLVQLINDMLDTNQKYSKRNIESKCSMEVFDKIEPVLPYIFEEENENYFPAIKKRIPVMLTEAERNSIKMMADDEIVGALMPPDMAKRLKGEYKGKGIFVDEYRYSPPAAYKTDSSLRESFYAIAEAISKKRYIAYSSRIIRNVPNGSLRAMPYKFVYSSRLNKLQLIIVPENEKRLVLVNLDSIYDVSVTEDSFDMDIGMLLKEQEDTLVLKIRKNIRDKEDKYRNIVDRCFSIFSHLDKESVYDEATDTYTIKVRYYKFDRKTVIRDILSMGSSVVVTEPEDIRNEIIADIRTLVERNL